jgi:hypothetical protein
MPVSVLEDLLEAEELDGAQQHAGVEPQAALVRPECRVVLHAEAAVDLHAPGVIGPRHPEDDLPLGLADPLEDRRLGVLGALGEHPVERAEHLAHGLVELGLAGVAGEDLLVDAVDRRTVLLHARGLPGW